MFFFIIAIPDLFKLLQSVGQFAFGNRATPENKHRFLTVLTLVEKHFLKETIWYKLILKGVKDFWMTILAHQSRGEFMLYRKRRCPDLVKVLKISYYTGWSYAIQTPVQTFQLLFSSLNGRGSSCKNYFILTYCTRKKKKVMRLYYKITFKIILLKKLNNNLKKVK